MHKGPNGMGLSRKAIFAEIDASLKRLGTDFVDLYQIHRWDPAVPIEETLEALDAVVRAGKALHIGASSMFAWQFAKALHVSDRHGWARFAAMQNYVNLLYREEEREMLPLCRDEGIGVIPWSPLARGRLAREWDATTVRSENDGFGRTLYAQTADADRKVAEAPAARAGRARLGARKERSHGADRRRDAHGAARRRSGRAHARARAGGHRRARGAVRAASGHRPRVRRGHPAMTACIPCRDVV